MAAWRVDVAAKSLCLASRILGRRAAELGLGPCPLCLGTTRLRVHRRLLGLLPRPARRAVSPVYFPRGLSLQSGFSYSPSIVINPSVFADSLFLRPQYQHYYFGDYYAANYQAAGFYPSYSYNSGRNGYDPIFAHERWQHRGDGQWEQRVAADFQNRRDHVNARPPRIWTAQTALGAGAGHSREGGIVMAAPLSSLIRSKDSPLRFQPVSPSERQKLGQQAQQVQQYGEQRQKLESGVAARPGEPPTRPLSPATAKLPLSPIAAQAKRRAGERPRSAPDARIAPRRISRSWPSRELPDRPSNRRNAR